MRELNSTKTRQDLINAIEQIGRAHQQAQANGVLTSKFLSTCIKNAMDLVQSTTHETGENRCKHKWMRTGENNNTVYYCCTICAQDKYVTKQPSSYKPLNI